MSKEKRTTYKRLAFFAGVSLYVVYFFLLIWYSFGGNLYSIYSELLKNKIDLLKNNLSLKAMHRQPVISTNLSSVGYDSITSTLEVEFLNGSVYQYSNVPSSIFNGLMSAGSKGQYFDRMIKKGGYSCRRLV